MDDHRGFETKLGRELQRCALCPLVVWHGQRERNLDLPVTGGVTVWPDDV